MAWPILPSAQVKLQGGSLLPTEGLRGDPRLLLCLGSHQGLLGTVTCILTQLKTALAGGTVPWERLWAEGLYWYHILTVVTSYAGSLQTALSQPVLQACTPQFQKGEFTQDHSSRGMPGADLQPPPSPITLSSNSEVHWTVSESIRAPLAGATLWMTRFTDDICPAACLLSLLPGTMSLSGSLPGSIFLYLHTLS